MISKTVDIAIGKVHLRTDGIIHLIVDNDQYVELEDRVEVVAAIEHLSGGEKTPLLIESGERVEVSNEAKQYDMDKHINAMVSMEALVITSLPTRIAAKFYYKFRKIDFKLKTFGKVDDAIQWIQLEQSRLKKAN